MTTATLPGRDPAAPSTVVAVEATAQDKRLVDAALRCIARWGVAKTTLDDVAREAGCSRATVYRSFPGGKDALLEAVTASEVARFFHRLEEAMATCDGLEDQLVAAIVESGRTLQSHAAVQFLLAHEPETILPRLAFRQMDGILRIASEFLAPWLSRWLEPEEARRAAEWAARIVLSYTCCPADDVDMGNEESVRALVRMFVLPGLARDPKP